MVNLTRALLMPRHYNNPSADGYWRKRQVFKLAAHFYGRSRNCFSIAIRRVQRSLQNVTAGRKIRKMHAKDVWNERISAGCQEFGHITEGSPDFLEALSRSEIYLNRQSLANLAIWEPRTFKAINEVAAIKAKQDNINVQTLGPQPSNVFTRGKL